MVLAETRRPPGLGGPARLQKVVLACPALSAVSLRGHQSLEIITNTI